MGGARRDGRRSIAPAGRFVELPGRGRTFVRELEGPEGAPVVVLLHGWAATAALNWSAGFLPLAEHFRVIALDHRGHGRGIRSSEPFRLEACADDVAALLDVLGVEQAIAVGYSMGGPIAQLLEQRHPRLVEGLVLCATSATFCGSVPERLLFGMASGSSVIAAALPMRPINLAALTLARGRRNLWWGWDEVARHSWSRIIEAGRAIGRFDSRSSLAGTSVPTAVVATEDDDLVPYRRQLALAEAIPGATLHVVSGGHCACVTAPEKFVPALVDACTEVAGRAAAGRLVAVAAA